MIFVIHMLHVSNTYYMYVQLVHNYHLQYMFLYESYSLFLCEDVTYLTNSLQVMYNMF